MNLMGIEIGWIFLCFHPFSHLVLKAVLDDKFLGGQDGRGRSVRGRTALQFGQGLVDGLGFEDLVQGVLVPEL